MRTSATACFIAFVLAGPAFATCAPDGLVRMETQNVSPAIPNDSFARQPKVMYRLGNGRARIEEQRDSGENVQMLFIVDVPRVWQIDLVAKTGELMVDTDEPPGLTQPVFSDETLPKEILAVEYGCEQQFIRDGATSHERTETKAGVAMKHSIRAGDWKFTITTREGSETPLLALLSQNDKVVGAIRYASWQRIGAVPDGLFAPPPGIAIAQSKP
jgi:hypothetical protein